MLSKTERLVRLILLLQARKRTCGELADTLEVSRRTIMRDVESLGRMGVPVISRSGPGGHYEMDAEQTLRPLELTGSEAFLLTLALDALQRLADVPFAQSRDTLAAKVAGLLPSTQLQRAFGRVGRVHLQVPTRPQRALNLSRLIEHCDQWAEVTYSVEEGEATYLARVQKVYADAGLWYVDAVIDGKRRNLRADRVLKIQGAQAPEQPIEPKEYDDPSHPTVRVILTGRGLRALERDPHLGGEVKDRKAPALIEFRCPPDELDWYARYFGGMGPDAEILGPPDLLEIVVGKAKALLQKYEKT